MAVSPLFESGRGRSTRGPLLGAFLVMTVLLAVWLGYEAVNAASSQRQAAEAVLGDYADIALTDYSGTAIDQLDDFLEELLQSTGHNELAEGEGLPSRREMMRRIVWELDDAAAAAGCRRCEGLRSPLATFAADVSTRQVVSLTDSVPPGRLLALADTIATVLPEEPIGEHWEGLIIAHGGRVLPSRVSVAYTAVRDSAGARVVAVVYPVDALRELFAEWYTDDRLLPEPIGAGLPNDSLLHVAVHAPDSTVIFASPVDYPMTLSASRGLGPAFGNIEVEVTMRPDQASALIIGGLPNSKLPLLIGLLVLTLGVGMAALVQFRQEVEFQRLRDDFVSGVSHELRTPLAQIRMFAELQESDKLADPADRKRAVSVIHREARRLTHLVDNILQFSRLRHADGRTMPMETLDLGKALEDGVDAMSSFLRDRSMTLHFEAEPGLLVEGSRDALTRVIVNLLDNAAKYGPEGQPVTVDVRRVDGHARISVTDEGPGVPPVERERIFKAYRRLERDVKARLPGSGIGLSVVSEIADMHRGRAWVESAEDGGARFVVELPLAEEITSTGSEEVVSDEEGRPPSGGSAASDERARGVEPAAMAREASQARTGGL